MSIRNDPVHNDLNSYDPANGQHPDYWQEVPWNFNDSYETATRVQDVSGNYIVNSSPGIAVYDLNEFNNSGRATDAERSEWIKQHTDILIINAQTGAIMR